MTLAAFDMSFYNNCKVTDSSKVEVNRCPLLDVASSLPAVSRRDAVFAIKPSPPWRTALELDGKSGGEPTWQEAAALEMSENFMVKCGEMERISGFGGKVNR